MFRLCRRTSGFLIALMSVGAPFCAEKAPLLEQRDEFVPLVRSMDSSQQYDRAYRMARAYRTNVPALIRKVLRHPAAGRDDEAGSNVIATADSPRIFQREAAAPRRRSASAPRLCAVAICQRIPGLA